MKNQTTLAARNMDFVSKLQATSWLNRRNELLSSIMDETVTNRQMCLISNFSLSLVCAIGAVSQSLIFGLCAFAYVVSAYHAMKKGGMTYDK